MLPFLQRLKQRKIVQWAVGYFAGAWLVLEVFDLVAEQFLWPAWVRQAATVLVFFGGLVTLVLAWYHGERGRQRVGAVELIVLVAILAVGGQSVRLLKDRNDRLDAETAAQPFPFREHPLPEHSVAVLPCRSLGRDEEQGYFADGLAAELITRLAAVSGLRIPSHTSSFSFRDQNVTLEAVAVNAEYRTGQERVLPGTLAITYACLDDHDESARLLWEARENEDVELLFLDDPCFDGMRADPRFIDLVRSMNLPGHIYLSSPGAAS